jgi:hypothetical protein
MISIAEIIRVINSVIFKNHFPEYFVRRAGAPPVRGASPLPEEP